MLRSPSSFGSLLRFLLLTQRVRAPLSSQLIPSLHAREIAKSENKFIIQERREEGNAPKRRKSDARAASGTDEDLVQCKPTRKELGSIRWLMLVVDEVHSYATNATILA
ncbi:hypothetical protein TGAM01_v207288 [Trichoderma gamsii]|uniref:Helicase ATP-binding domain-containing protein n=1 Tax=Trichoderma gamsii TaxID=398673 RepID=A0A0W7VU75_9HYPO|nr:hypothetical protein TGAM01_v207288 [Trichoderma gamsii]PNP41420.1 hypothetical protein TGAMA5MH_06746 [Trichoderma gamsii]PON23960.1 hypothetical protein TGAM01_v207288 [Trichoderma gamsii]